VRLTASRQTPNKDTNRNLKTTGHPKKEPKIPNPPYPHFLRDIGPGLSNTGKYVRVELHGAPYERSAPPPRKLAFSIPLHEGPITRTCGSKKNDQRTMQFGPRGWNSCAPPCSLAGTAHSPPLTLQLGVTWAPEISLPPPPQVTLLRPNPQVPTSTSPENYIAHYSSGKERKGEHPLYYWRANTASLKPLPHIVDVPR
jgi:hypothetical protein